MYKKILKEKKTVLYLVLSIAYHLTLIVFNLGIPLLLGFLVDTIIPSSDIQNLYLWLFFVVFILIIYKFFLFLFPNYFYFKFEIVTTRILQLKLLKKYFGMKNYMYEKYDFGKLFNIIISDLPIVVSIIFTSIVAFSYAIVTVLIYSVAIALIFPIAVPIVLIFLPVYCGAIFINQRRLQKIQVENVKRWDNFTSCTKHAIGNKKQINILKSNKYFLDEFSSKADSHIESKLSYWYWYFLSQEMPSLVSQILKYVCLFAGAVAIINDQLTIGALLVISSYIDSMVVPINDAAHAIIRKNANEISFERVSAFFSQNKDDSYGELLQDQKALLDIKNIEILNRDKSVLFEIDDLKIKKNGVYQIIGLNGVGKTSFINLMLNIQSAEFINIKKTGILSINKDISERVVYLSYPHLFINTGVKENILINKTESKNFNKIIDLLKIDFLDKHVDANNVNLSLGEQQKVSLARVLLEQGDVLILDEPVANIDIETSKKVAEYLNEIKTSKIIIVVSHDVVFENIRDYSIEIKDGQLKVNK